MAKLTLREKIGLKLKNLWVEYGLTQEALAEKLNYGNKNTVGKIERGESYISEQFLTKACKFFDVEESYFYTFKDILIEPTKENYIGVINADLRECEVETLEKISEIVKTLKPKKSL